MIKTRIVPEMGFNIIIISVVVNGLVAGAGG